MGGGGSSPRGGLEVVPGVIVFPYGAYLREESAVLVADLHLGLEDSLRGSGVVLPRGQLPRILPPIEGAIRRFEPERIIILGDVKHEFGGRTRLEWEEVSGLIRALRGAGVEVEVVRGNHDNYLVPVLARMSVRLWDPHLRLGRFLLTHGHRSVDPGDLEGVDAVLAGHEHPAVALGDPTGPRVRFRCALSVPLPGGRRLVVLPAASPLLRGVDVLTVPRGSWLSPLLRGADVGSAEVIAVDREVGAIRLGTVSELRSAFGIGPPLPGPPEFSGPGPRVRPPKGQDLLR